MLPEIWKPIPGYEGLYEVSSLGRIKSVSRYVKNNIAGHVWQPEKILKLRNARYKNVMICRDGVEAIIYIHRLVAEVFVPNPFNKPTVNHKDGDTHNNKSDNLEWATVFENQKHAVETDLFKTQYGANPYSGKNISDVVAGIRGMYRSGEKQKRIASVFGVDQSTVSRIVNNHRWRESLIENNP